MRKIEIEIEQTQKRVADYANNLAEWFSTDRDIPENFSGKLRYEPVYVKSMLTKLEKEYKKLEDLTNLEKALF